MRMVNYDTVLRNILVTDIPYSDMMSKEASMLQILRNEYLNNASKFDKLAR